MDLISLLILLIVVGAILYIASILPIDATIKKIIQIVAIVGVSIYLIRSFLPALLGHHF
jgi:hypothetical protein